MDELSAELFFATEPTRRRLRPQLLSALQGSGAGPLKFDGWVRSITYQFSDEPLSCAGSLMDIGGRFNAGFELDDNTLSPWPALYLAQDLETAFREKFSIASNDNIDGLTPQELALDSKVSHTNLRVRGNLESVFLISSFQSLNSVASVLKRVKMPKEAARIRKVLKVPPSSLNMVQNGIQLFDLVMKQNWRVYPRQFGLPAPSQILAELIRAAGFEAIQYQSSKGPGLCMAIFPENLTDTSFIEIIDPSPRAVTLTRMDSTTSEQLEGWEVVPKGKRK